METDPICGIGSTNSLVDGFTGATALGQAKVVEGAVTNAIGEPLSILDMVIGLIPGSIGETSVIAIALGAIFLLWTGTASWKTMLSVFVGGGLTAYLFNLWGANPAMQLPWYEHLLLGGFCFGAVFMATDPVTSPRTDGGKYIYGFLVGFFAIVIRCMGSYPEGMMLAILLMNLFTPLINYCFVQANISRRMKRVANK